MGLMREPWGLPVLNQISLRLENGHRTKVGRQRFDRDVLDEDRQDLSSRVWPALARQRQLGQGVRTLAAIPG
jgi:hypothetical protein